MPENKITDPQETEKDIISQETKTTTPDPTVEEINDPTVLESSEKEKADEEEKIDPEKFLEDFDWHNYQEGIGEVEQETRQEFESMVASSFVETKSHEIVNGTITRITDREAIIDINAKSEGVISLNEFRYNPDLKEGDEVYVLIDQQEDKTGQLILSHRKARSIKAWERAIAAYESGEIVNGHVNCRTKGGMIVEVFGIEAFLPGSQIDVKPIRDYDLYVGKTMEFKVVKVNHDFKNIVVSHKALIEADLAEQKKEIMSQLEKGQVIEGTVKNLTSYGVFVDLGGVDGLVHITDISWNRISSPSEVLELDQKVKVVILDFDEKRIRIQLGIKQLEEHPWEKLDKDIKAGDKVKGKVTVITDYGAFVEVVDSVEGLVHVSEMSWSTHLRSAQDFVKVGDEIEVVILSLDREDRKMALGMKQLIPDPWSDITTKYPVGSRHRGIVRNFTNFGIFVELEEGIDGLVYISDISWNKKIAHPSDFVKIGETLDVLVLELDVDNRKLSLGHKQTKENPWDKYEEEYHVDSIHEGELVKMIDKGGIVEFTEEVSGFIPKRFLTKEDGSLIKRGETSKFKVIEFNKDFKKIVASHTHTFKDVENRSSPTSVNRNISKNNKTNEKSTFGDLGVFANLKGKKNK